VTTTPQPHALDATVQDDSRPRAMMRRLALLDDTRCSGREVIVVSALLFVLAFAVYGVYVARGVLVFDDLTLAYDVHRSRETHGLLGAFSDLLSGDVLTGSSPGRPTEAAYNVLIHSAFGTNAALHLATAVALAALVAVLFYVVLRWFRLERLHAAAIAVLVLLFPGSDSTVYWATGAIAHVTLVLYLLGTICAIGGLRAHGRSGYALHALACALYASSILQYQIAAPLVLLSVFVYRMAGASWRLAISRWIVDAIVASVALVYVRGHLERREGSVSESLQHARDIAGAARELLVSLGIQDGRQRLPIVALLIVILLASAGAIFLPSGDARRDGLRRWLRILIGGFITIGVAYAIFVPGDFYYSPAALGIGNRVNAVAALGFATAIYSLVVLSALLVFWGLSALRLVRADRGVPLTAVIAALMVVALSLLYFSALSADRGRFERAAAVQRNALRVVKTITPPPSGTTVYLFGVDVEPSPNVFTFVRPNDLSAALRLLWRDDAVNGILVSTTDPDWSVNTKSDSGIECGVDGVRPHGWLYPQYRPTPYGRTLFVNVPSRASTYVDDRAGCLSALRLYNNAA
jgi:hypothetical protein